MKDLPIMVALRIAMRSLPSLSTKGTAITSLVVVPLLQVVLMLTIATAMGVGQPLLVVYAGLVIATMTTVLIGGVSMVTRDRGLGVAVEILTTRPLSPSYWVTRFLPAGLISLSTAILTALAAFALDPSHNLGLLIAVVLAVGIGGVAGGAVGMACAGAALAGRDPFSVANIIAASLPITAGVLLPHSHYPVVFKQFSAVMPGTWLVEALRGIAAGGTWGQFAATMLLETVVSGVWCLVGLILIRRAASALYQGAPTSLM